MLEKHNKNCQFLSSGSSMAELRYNKNSTSGLSCYFPVFMHSWVRKSADVGSTHAVSLCIQGNNCFKIHSYPVINGLFLTSWSQNYVCFDYIGSQIRCILVRLLDAEENIPIISDGDMLSSESMTYYFYEDTFSVSLNTQQETRQDGVGERVYSSSSKQGERARAF